MENVKNHASDEYLLLEREREKQRNLPKRVSCRPSSASRFARKFVFCAALAEEQEALWVVRFVFVFNEIFVQFFESKNAKYW